ncbi:hypothetical protein B4U84_13360 [Westiellopsis prolifica IICB1]|nr:hypothetical protein B4U84_13360 [Westiellopsis prolifica IICB1]
MHAKKLSFGVIFTCNQKIVSIFTFFSVFCLKKRDWGSGKVGPPLGIRGNGDSPEETLRVDASAASHRVRGLGIGDRV